MPFTRRIATHLLLLVLSAALPLSGVIAYLIYESRVEAEARAFERVRELARDIADDSQKILDEAKDQLTLLSTQPAVRALERSPCDPLIAGIQRLKPIYTMAILADLKGDVVCWALDKVSTGTNYADRAWFRNAIASDGFRTETPIFGRAAREFLIPLTMPVRDAAGKTVGALNLAANLREITRLVDRPRLPAGSAVTIVSGDGLVIARSLDPDQWLGREVRSVESIATQLAQHQGTATMRGLDGVERVVAFTTMPETGWLVSAGIPLDAAMAGYRRALRRILLVALVVIAGAIVFAVVVAKAIRNPIHALAAAAGAVARGETGVRALEAGPLELATVGREFNHMLAVQAEAVDGLKRRTSQLEAANKELEAFSYSASHDLRQPLQTIDGYSRMLLDDYGDRLDADAKSYLQRLRGAAQHIARLIDDLLQLARLTRSEMTVGPVDLSAIALATAAELRARDLARDVAFDIAAGAIAHGDESLLAMLVQQLLANAWAFTSMHPRANIAFGITERGGERVYFVRDDGAGFDMARADKLFVPFQRLHADADFPGKGLGLALARRIVLRHGGRIWAEAKPEQGAAFYFTLPDAPEASAEQEPE